MNRLTDQLRHAMDEITAWKPTTDGVRVTTQCMYPSNSLVNVHVRGGVNSAVVSDDGGALSEAFSAGVTRHIKDGQLTHLVASQGLSVKGGVIRSRPVPLDQVPLAILLVANASKEVASWLYDHANIKKTRDFPQALSNLLHSMFEDRLTHRARIRGKRKQHMFANVIELPNEIVLIVDPVANEQSSINARVVANLDVQQADNPRVKQRLVYDDEEDWSPDSLSLLGIVGAPVIPFSKSSLVIKRVAALDD